MWRGVLRCRGMGRGWLFCRSVVVEFGIFEYGILGLDTHGDQFLAKYLS